VESPFKDRVVSGIALNSGEPLVFHYTGAAGALGILKNAEMWCTLASHMNDKQECRFAHGVAKRIAYTELSKADTGFREKFTVELTEQLERYEVLKVYVACFSECEDLLSQWRGYGGNSGYALGFSSNALKALGERQGFAFDDVKYKNDEHEALLRPIILDLISKFDSNWDRKEHRKQIEDAFGPSMASIAAKAAIIKHPSFSEEREWRLHSKPMFGADGNIDFIVRANRIVPIAKVNLDNGSFGPPYFRRDICVRGCVVGPGPEQAERSEAISALASKLEVSIREIEWSSAPLR
jgi:Protein of unknown function (DUF2971)